MRSILLKVLAGLAALALSQTAAAQSRGIIDVPEHPSRPVILELFSSQGCGNCPQANENLAGLAKRSDVIALTYPVGIWDYLGWSDTLAKPEFAARQTDYNHSLHHRGPYTPEIVYSGRLHSSGVNLKSIENGFANRPLDPYAAKVTFEPTQVTISGDYDGKASVVLIRFKPGMATVTPGAGVNKNKLMQYYNVVTSVRTLGDWSGGQVSFPLACDSGCAVLVQKDSPTGHVIGAAQKK